MLDFYPNHHESVADSVTLLRRMMELYRSEGIPDESESRKGDAALLTMTRSPSHTSEMEIDRKVLIVH